VRFIGRRKRPRPARLVKLIEDTEARTADNDRMQLTIAFNYGGQAELVDAAQAAGQGPRRAGTLKRIDERAFAARLYDPTLPDVDLHDPHVRRAAGANFLIWQAAYAELVFVDTLWPDFNRIELARCVAEYQRRERRFGKAVDKVVSIRAGSGAATWRRRPRRGPGSAVQGRRG
jgi:undecaprenyl diphosphate synthase